MKKVLKYFRETEKFDNDPAKFRQVLIDAMTDKGYIRLKDKRFRDGYMLTGDRSHIKKIPTVYAELFEGKGFFIATYKGYVKAGAVDGRLQLTDSTTDKQVRIHIEDIGGKKKVMKKREVKEKGGQMDKTTRTSKASKACIGCKGATTTTLPPHNYTITYTIINESNQINQKSTSDEKSIDTFQGQ